MASGIWPLFRWDPRRPRHDEPPLVIDAPAGKIPVHEYMQHESRFRMVEKLDPVRFKKFAEEAQRSAERRVTTYEHVAKLRYPRGEEEGEE